MDVGQNPLAGPRIQGLAVRREPRHDSQLIGPAIAAEPLRVGILIEVDALIELIFVNGRVDSVLVIPVWRTGQSGLIRQREEFHQEEGSLVDAG